MVLTLASFVCVERPRYRATERFETNQSLWVATGDQRSLRTLQNLSITGARFSGAPTSKIGEHLKIEIGGTAIEATVVRAGPDYFAVAFEHSVSTRAAMTRHFYASGYYKTFKATHPLAIGMALAARVFT